MDYQIIEAFAPKIYLGKTDQYFLTFCREKEQELRSKKLQDQAFVPLNINEEDRSKFLTQMNDNISNAINEFNKGINRVQNNQDEKLLYDLGKGPWIHYMQKNYFQPMFRSPGMITGLIFIDVPVQISDANSIGGDLSFTYGEEGFWHSNMVNLKPETGDIIIFPSYLRHQFYPYTHDTEYPILGFNIFNIRKPEGESR